MPSTRQFPSVDVYPITDAKFGWTHVELARYVIKAGVEILQFREKKKGIRTCIEIGRKLRRLTNEQDVRLIVNDRVDLAQAIHAEGVHIGQEDMPLQIAREILGKEKIIGVSVETKGQAIVAEENGADYLGVGPLFPTSTKEDAGPTIDLLTLREISRAVEIPIVGIGGIDASNVKKVIENGADGVAVISAIADKKNPQKATRKLLEIVRKAKKIDDGENQLLD